MTDILHSDLPADMRPLRALPGLQPVQGAWLRTDEVYAQQMAHRATLISTRRDEVIYQEYQALGAAQELLQEALAEADWPRRGDVVTCPDGRQVVLDWQAPMATLGHLFQCDFALMDRTQDAAEHRLVAAVLCFPASWSLAEKAGRPLTEIHQPVGSYDTDMARRVQRLFDGVQAGRPMWRCNGLWYAEAELFQPRSALAPRQTPSQGAPFYRSERQTIVRLPLSRAVVFVIHTYVLRAASLSA
ncbi:MAG: DUF3445 domain-containing protein [Pseudomonadota bacterium]